MWQDNGEVKCQCPTGFKGDGVNSCTGKTLDIFLVLIVSVDITNLGYKIWEPKGISWPSRHEIRSVINSISLYIEGSFICFGLSYQIRRVNTHAHMDFECRLNDFCQFPYRCWWVQREESLSVLRMQLQKHLGKLRVQLQWGFVVYQGPWHLHKWVSRQPVLLKIRGHIF